MDPLRKMGLAPLFSKFDVDLGNMIVFEIRPTKKDKEIVLKLLS